VKKEEGKKNEMNKIGPYFYHKRLSPLAFYDDGVTFWNVVRGLRWSSMEGLHL
jgi:hypothetical protein